MKRPVRACLLSIALLSIFLPGPGHAEEWEYDLELYALGAGLNGTTGLGSAEGVVDLSFDDILDDLEIAGMASFRAQRDRWAILADMIFVGLGQSNQLVDVDIDQLILELDAFYRVNEVFGVLVGGRYVDVETKLAFLGPLGLSAGGGRSWIDPVIGVGVEAPMSERWTFYGRLDGGGFGVGSDFTYQAKINFGYHPSDRVTVRFGYRLLDFDYEDGSGPNRILLDLELSGPSAGVAFHF